MTTRLKSRQELAQESRELYLNVAAERDALKLANSDLQAWYDAAIVDAKRYRWVITAGSEWTLRLHNTRPDCRQALIDAAMEGNSPKCAACNGTGKAT